MIIQSDKIEINAARTVAELMIAAARTAPKGRGIDNLELMIVEGEAKKKLADEMRLFKEDFDTDFFFKDGECVDKSHVVVLLGIGNDTRNLGDCGFCGFNNCAENRLKGGMCTSNPIDLGIALGSAVSIAADHRCDNRILFTAGVAAMKLGYFNDKIKIAYGIPLSISGKNPFFDR